MVAYKWWSGVTHVATSDGKLRRLTDNESAAEEVKSIMLAKPSVRSAILPPSSVVPYAQQHAA